MGDMKFHPTFIDINYQSHGKVILDFNPLNGFNAAGGSGGAGSVTSIGASQFEKKTGFTGGSLCEGVYDLSRAGFHTLSLSHGSGSYWVSGQDDADSTGRYVTYDKGFYVTSTPVAITADLTLLSPITDNFDQTGCDDFNLWCDGADTNQDGDVNALDIGYIFEDAGDAVDIEEDMYLYETPVDTGNEGSPDAFIPVTNSPILSQKLKRDIYLAANDGVNGVELWRIGNGGDLELFDIRAGSDSSNPSLLTETHNALYFVANTDSLSVGLFELYPGEEPVLIQDNIGPIDKYISLTFFQGELYFTKITEGNSRELWRVDDETGSASKIADIGRAVESPSRFVTAGGQMYFGVYERTRGHSLWSSDGAGAQRIVDLGHYRPCNLTAMGRSLYFTSAGALWRADESSASAERIASVAVVAPEGGRALAVLGDMLIFAACDSDTGVELWRSDGTTEGTVLIRDLNLDPGSSNPVNLIRRRNYVYFTMSGDVNETLLCKTDGTAAGTVTIASFSAEGYRPYLHSFSRLFHLHFLVGDKLWKCRWDEVFEVEELSAYSVRAMGPVGDKLLIATDAGERGSCIWTYAPQGVPTGR